MRRAALPLILFATAALAPAPRGVSALRDPARLVELGRAVEAQDVRQAANFYDLALSVDPLNAGALKAAGDLALRRGEGAQAYAYFSKLANTQPRDPAGHFGLGASLILRMQPGDALKALAEAERLGATPVSVGPQRGLAYDLMGDHRSAQVAYAGALARAPTDIEIARRLALSLAISGSRPAALQVLRRFEANEAAAVPLRQSMALIYALTGDPETADEIAASILPPTQARQMSGFFASLGALSPSEKTVAALFGRLPDGKTAVVSASRAIAAAAPPPPAPARASPPQRLWVQVANVADASRIGEQWDAIVKAGKGASDLRNPRTTPAPAGNRLLIGPFATRSDANDAVLRLKNKGVSAFPVTTPKGAVVTDLKGAAR